MAALRSLLGEMAIPDRGKVDRAFQDAEEEVAKPDPDKEEVAGAVSRVLKAARGAEDFRAQIETLSPIILNIAAWAGPPGEALLSKIGLGT